MFIDIFSKNQFKEDRWSLVFLLEIFIVSWLEIHKTSLAATSKSELNSKLIALVRELRNEFEELKAENVESFVDKFLADEVEHLNNRKAQINESLKADKSLHWMSPQMFTTEFFRCMAVSEDFRRSVDAILEELRRAQMDHPRK